MPHLTLTDGFDDRPLSLHSSLAVRIFGCQVGALCHSPSLLSFILDTLVHLEGQLKNVAGSKHLHVSSHPISALYR